ncbi:MAG TPA: hypothetical protein DIS77_07915 [Rothia sp.]|nr:hypothetical protein [Rothia sp. (in: high G+C Gram-positive bacteria)]
MSVNIFGRLLASFFDAQSAPVPVTGSVVFRPRFMNQTGDGALYLGTPAPATLDSEGRFEIELVDSPSSWQVALNVKDKAGNRLRFPCFDFLPAPGVERINFADIVPLADPVTGEPMLRGEPGVGISSVSFEDGKLRVATTDGQITLLDLPAAELDTDTLQGYTTKTELVEALAQFTPPETSPFTAGARYYSPVTYYWPDYYKGAESQWGKVLRFGENLGIVVMNRNSGEWTTYDKDFHTQAQLAKGAGAKRAVYYVKTQYGAAANPQKWGVGVPDAAKYTKEYILGQLEYCATHYPDTFEGVFLDEFINGWGTQSERLPWYKDLVDAIRARFGKGFLIVGNCGSNCSEEVLALDVDVYMSFESTAATYLADNPASPIHPAHMAKHPGTRFWHVVHDVTPDNYQQVFAKAESMGIGHLYITDGKLVMGEGGQWQPDVNPYAVAPSQWIADLLRPWLRGVLDTRLLAEALANRVATLESGAAGGGVKASDNGNGTVTLTL